MTLLFARARVCLVLSMLVVVSSACGDDSPQTMPAPIGGEDGGQANFDARPGVNPIVPPTKTCYITEILSNSESSTKALGESAKIERDEKGRPVKVEIDENLDGKADETYSYTFDEKGNVALLEWDTDGDGAVDGSSTHTNTYEGDKLVQVEYEPIPCCSAARLSYTWDGDQVKKLVREDLEGDRVTYVETFDYEDGVLVKHDVGYGGRGGATWTYDEDAGLLEQVRRASDDTVSERTLYKYDELGNLISIEEDSNGDGTIDITDTYTNTYALGRLVQIDVDEDSDDTIDEIWTYTYEMNVLVKVDFDRNADGMSDGEEVFRYMGGRVNYHSKNYNGDRYKEIEDRYDANGYPTQRFRDFASTGSFMVYEEYRYKCVDEAIWWPDFDFPVSMLSSVE